MGGINGEYPPGDEAGFHAFLSGLHSPLLAQTIARAKPISAIRTHRALSNHARHFERWTHHVGGFVALGDSAVAFNAAYGQGMSMAVAAANVLGELLPRVEARKAFELTRRFHEAQWRTLRTAWDVATGADLRWPATAGTRPRGHALSAALGNLIVRAAHDDPLIRRQLGPVVRLLVEPRTVLTSPRLLARVLMAEIRRRMGSTLRLPAPLEHDEPSPL